MLRLTRRTIAVLVIWMCVFAVRAVAADEITACVNPAGQARLVAADQACRPQERRVTWNVAGPQGPQGVQGPQGPQGEQGPAGESAAGGSSVPMVVDSIGQVLGPIVSTDGHVLVGVATDRFFAKVTATGFARGGALIFNSPTCGGAAYMMATLTENAVAHPAIVNGATAWVVSASTPNVLPAPNAGSVYAFSRRMIDAAGNVGACTALNWPAAATLWPLKQVDLGHFLPPFAIQ